MDSVNPRDGSLIARYDTLDVAALGTKLAVAHMAYSEWRREPLSVRTKAAAMLGEKLLMEKESLATLMTDEMGKPIRQARAEIEKCAGLCQFYSEMAPTFLSPRTVKTEASESYVRYDPLGPILGIMPWNYPVWQVIRFAVPTLLIGNVVLLKHAPNVSGCALAIEKLFHDSGFSDGIYSALLLDVEHVDKVIADPRTAGVSLTGSVSAGVAVAEAAGRNLKPSVLELGGSDPFIVLADADLDAAVDAAVSSRTLNSGQSCIAAKRFLVERPVHDAFVERMRAAMQRLVLGDPREEATDIGPLARPDLVSNLHFQVKTSIELGAKLELGGAPVDQPGNYYPPTLLTGVTRGMPVFDEETFGPV
ncbi:MAG: aldehyde dehydrogenase family protein, partial [Myxococcota bacterium]